MNGFITPKDVALRLLRRHPHWFHGEPAITLEGNRRSFGWLTFDFGDEKVQYRIYIHDEKTILDAAAMAVKNFDQYVDEIFRNYD